MFARGVGFNKFIRGIKPRRVTVQRSFIVINKPFAHAGGVLFKNIEGLFIPSDLVLKNIGLLYISAGVFGAGISLPVRLDQELKKVLQVGRIRALSMLPMYVLKILTPYFAFLY